MAEIPEGFREAEFGGNFLLRNGPYYLKRSEDGWLVGQWVEERHVNYIGIAHGGMLSTLADVALSAQPFFSEQPNPAVTTTTLTTNFLAAAKLGDWLVADTRIGRMSKRTAHVYGAIYRGEEILVTMSGVFAVHRPGAGG
jgi:uncharacterized protein (TIGR00369 family)